MRVARTTITIAAVAVALSACATARPFDRLLSERRWADAATAFAGDSTLMNDEHALHSAGMLFGSPARSTYDPERARLLLQRLLARFPDSKYAVDAEDRLALLEATSRLTAITVRTHELEARIAELTAQQQRVRAERDSVVAQSDVLRRGAGRLEADLRDRDEQLRVLRLELRQLKEIDLKPRQPPRRPSQRD
ncbi:MAG: hypothetical protein ABJE47_05745 [bacterium]